MRMVLAILGVAAAGLGGAVAAHEFKVGDLVVEHPWARPAASGNGAAYLELINGGTDTDRLVSAASDRARSVELHAHTIDAQGVARMRPVQAIDIPAGGNTRLAPGGLHLMLLDLTGPLKEGESFPLALTFEKAGTVTVEVAVESKPGHAGHDHGAPAN